MIMNNWNLMKRERYWAWPWLLLMALLLVPATMQAADWVRDKSKYSMSNSTDHVYFEIFLADLDGHNTYSTSGSIYAEPADGKGGGTLQLIELYTYDMSASSDKDEWPQWDVKARVISSAARAWFTNGFGVGEVAITNGSSVGTYSLQKWGSDYHYLTAKINYYFPAEMAGRKWKFYYKFHHNNDKSNVYTTMVLGTHTLSQDVGCNSFNVGGYSYERKHVDKFTFTVPELPNDVPEKVKDVRSHVGIYYLTATYTLQSGSTFMKRDTFNCESSKKTYDVAIPLEAGNFKRADLKVEVLDALKDSKGDYFWNNRTTYTRKNIFTSVPVPFGLAAEYNQFDKKTELVWNGFETGDNNYIHESVPYVYRRKVEHDGTPMSGEGWDKRGNLSEVNETQAQNYIDRNVDPNVNYQYMVVNVPNPWTSNNSINTTDLNAPTDELLNRLGYAMSDVVGTSPTVDIYDLQQDVNVKDKVQLTWKYSRVPVSANQVTFQVLKREMGSAQWNEFTTVNAPSNPSSSDVVAVTDSDLPDSQTAFEYKVRLSINNDENVFESSVLKAGLLSGTTVTSLDATKGTHETTVRVSWHAKQVGTNSTNYELFRRYAETNDEFMQVYSTSGTSDSYTYEDNTVKSGYFYEYKVEAYSGNKTNADDNTFQNSLVTTGFCQSRGVVSGNINFGSTGKTAVEDVRVSLRPNGDSDGNAVRSLSKRFEGASTGIVWDVDETETNKVFGNGKNFTLQFFVRPDDDLKEGAVIGEIPNLGRLLVGSKETDGYRLVYEKSGEKTTEKGHFTSVRYLKGCWYVNSSYVQTVYDEDLQDIIYNHNDFNIKDAEIKAQGYTRVCHNMWKFKGQNIIFVLYKQDVPGNFVIDNISWQGTLYDTRQLIPFNTFSLITMQHSADQEVIGVNDSISTSFTQLSVQNHKISSTNIEGIEGYDVYNNCLYVLDANLATTEQTIHWISLLAGDNDTNRGFTSNGSYTTEPYSVPFPFSIGGTKGITDDEGFKGNITEVRVFDHKLTEKEQQNYFDRYLNGRETGLKLYWPMDEGLNRQVFDASYSNDLPNGRHAVVGSNITSSAIIPTEVQLSRYALTNENGEYTVRGIPYIGSGTSYTFTPTKGIHTFSPSSRTGFIGTGNMVLNNYDFTDDSSFPMRGKITYLNTNIPSDSIQFRIDGGLVQSLDGMVCSDANGEYEISVPIGRHRIECFRQGHRLTSFPMDGNTYDFKEAITVNFVDSTLVNVTGRINGGYSDQDEPVGFGRSINRLGRAVIKLSLGKQSQCSFNYILDEHASGSFGTTDLPVESATERINSTTYRAGIHDGGTQDDTHYIYITTDEQTGEFSAMLPPLKYKVESIRFVGGTDYDDLPVFKQNLPIIDATNTVDEQMKADTLNVDGKTMEYKYTSKFMRQYRAEPTITVAQTGMENGAFGEVKVPVMSHTITNDSVTVVNYIDDGYSYTYNYPLFRQQEHYEFDIDVMEHYVNLDSHESFDEVPADAIVNIANDASINTIVYGESQIVDGEEVPAGTEYEVMNVQVRPDAKGHVSYQWEGGWPNLGGNYVRNLSISVTSDGRTTMWHAPNSQGDALDLILLGALCTGTNFVTSGPDHVDMILRRPPGASSFATMQTDTIWTTSYKKEYVTDSWSIGGGFYLSPAPTMEVGIMTGFVCTNSRWNVVANTTDVWEGKWKDSNIESNQDSYSVSEVVKTPTDILSVQNNGDTYIGRATNMQFGEGRMVGIFKQSDGTYKLDQQNAVTIGESFGTYFVYSQRYLLTTLIPNWQKLIDDKLTHVEGDHWDSNNPNLVKVPGKIMYYTSYNKGDAEWGRANGDKRWSDEQQTATDYHPSYVMVNGTDDPDAEDEVNLYINQVVNWQKTIADNEEEKLQVFEDSENKYLIDNYSIGGGTSISRTTTMKRTDMSGTKHDYTWSFNTENKGGLLLNACGGFVIFKYGKYDGDSWQKDTTVVKQKTIAWTMSDGDPYNSISCDVFNSPKGYGPIFRTRGGQTRNPYEPATYTLYHRTGTKLDEATMRIEYPQLKVIGSTELTDVPSGGNAKFILELQNLSETNSICSYVLEAPYAANADGAQLWIDGAPLSIGRMGMNVLMQGGETMRKTLIINQSDRSVTDFKDIAIILRSEKDVFTHSDTIRLNIHFVPASAPVEMAVDHTVLNLKDLQTYGGFKTTLFNLDRQDAGLLGLRVQYRRKGSDSWNLAHQWRVNAADLQEGDELLPETGDKFECAVSFPEDGVYEMRGQSFGKYGQEEVTFATDIIEVTQDTRGPKVLGMPSHDGGTLTFADRNQMHVRFNEVLNENALSQSDNFRIDGYLNNASVKSAYADVALQLNGDELRTEASYNLTNSDFAFGMWLYRQTDGNIISLGSTDDKMSLFTHDGGKIAARVGDDNDVYDAGATLPADIWTYIGITYKRKNANDPQNRISMFYVNAETGTTPVYVGDNIPAGDLKGHGKLTIGGDGLKGMMRELTLWNVEKTTTELYETRDQIKAAYTPGLVGYWRMDEGHGTTIYDKSRSRHMLMPTESWYINNRNLAAHIDGENPIKINVSTFSPRSTDNYALEMWFRGDKVDDNHNAQLFSVLNAISVGFSEGKLVLEKSKRELVAPEDNPEGAKTEKKTVSERIVLSDVDYIDNEWHHFALNVRRGTSAIAYVDGQAVKTIPESSIPGIAAHYMMIGGEETLLAADGTPSDGTNGVTTNCFTGDVDEVRIWATALTNDLIDERRYERMENGLYALYGYFPMESINRSPQGNVETAFSTENFGYTESQVKIDNTLTESINAPALKPGSSRIRLADTDFDFTASNDAIYFSFKPDMLARMDGNEFVVTVSDIKDEHGNASEPVTWKFYCDFSVLQWFGEAQVTKKWDETVEFSQSLYNLTGNIPQSYEISGLPQWMTVDQAIGTSEWSTTSVNFTVLPTVPVGQYTEYIYVTGPRGIRRVLPVNVKVTGEVPDWSVDPNRYESNMTVTGQLYVGDKISEYTDSKIAAFDDMGLCRGVASPEYVSTRDAYYVNMIIYGASSTDISSGERDLYFQMYDASTGTTYPVVLLTTPDGVTKNMLTYAPDATIGTYDTPVVFRSTDDQAQKTELPRGWTWMSIYLNPASTAIADILPSSKTELKKFQNIKSKTELASVSKDGIVMGSLENIVPGSMYKVQVSAPATLHVLGKTIDVTQTEQTIWPGYNWIGSLSNVILSPEDAFADLAPVNNDMVKTRTAMATYRDGVWEGTLKNIVPGEGYIYTSKATEAKTFHYPRTQLMAPQWTAGAREFADAALNGFDDDLYYHPVDEHQYPDNMNVIAVIWKDGLLTADAEMAAFVNDECRGAVGSNSYYYFLTILGSSADDVDSTVELRVRVDGEEYIVDYLSFVSDNIIGTLDEPYVIDLDAIGIRQTGVDADDEGEWYTLQGLKIGRKPTAPGVYIHNGRKVVIKREKE